MSKFDKFGCHRLKVTMGS